MAQIIVQLESELQAACKTIKMHEANPAVDREFEDVYEKARLSQNASLKKSLGKDRELMAPMSGRCSSNKMSGKRGGHFNRERHERLKRYNPPMQHQPTMPSPSDYPEHSKPVKRHRVDAGNEEGWTVYEKKDHDVKPIKAPTREAFDRFSAKSKDLSETLS